MSRSVSLTPFVLPFSVLYIQLNVNPMEKSKVFVNGIKNIEVYFLHSKNGFHKIFINKRYPGLNDWFGWVFYWMGSNRKREKQNENRKHITRYKRRITAKIWRSRRILSTFSFCLPRFHAQFLLWIKMKRNKLFTLVYYH